MNSHDAKVFQAAMEAHDGLVDAAVSVGKCSGKEAGVIALAAFPTLLVRAYQTTAVTSPVGSI